MSHLVCVWGGSYIHAGITQGAVEGLGAIWLWFGSTLIWPGYMSCFTAHTVSLIFTLRPYAAHLCAVSLPILGHWSLPVDCGPRLMPFVHPLLPPRCPTSPLSQASSRFIGRQACMASWSGCRHGRCAAWVKGGRSPQVGRPHTHCTIRTTHFTRYDRY